MSKRTDLIRITHFSRVLSFGTLLAVVEIEMEDREQKFGTNDMGLIVFVVVSVWLIFQSSLF